MTASFFRAEVAVLVNIAEGPNLVVVQEARAHFILLLKESRLSMCFPCHNMRMTCLGCRLFDGEKALDHGLQSRTMFDPASWTLLSAYQMTRLIQEGFDMHKLH